MASSDYRCLSLPPLGPGNVTGPCLRQALGNAVVWSWQDMGKGTQRDWEIMKALGGGSGLQPAARKTDPGCHAQMICQQAMQRSMARHDRKQTQDADSTVGAAATRSLKLIAAILDRARDFTRRTTEVTHQAVQNVSSQAGSQQQWHQASN